MGPVLRIYYKMWSKNEWNECDNKNNAWLCLSCKIKSVVVSSYQKESE